MVKLNLQLHGGNGSSGGKRVGTGSGSSVRRGGSTRQIQRARELAETSTAAAERRGARGAEARATNTSRRAQKEARRAQRAGRQAQATRNAINESRDLARTATSAEERRGRQGAAARNTQTLSKAEVKRRTKRPKNQ